MVEEDIIFPILPRRADAPVPKKSPDGELDEEELFYRRPTHVLRPSNSSVGSSSSSSSSHIARKEGDMSDPRIQPTLSRRASVPFQPPSVLTPAQDPSAGWHSNLSMNGSSRRLPSTKKPNRTAPDTDKQLTPPPGSKSGAFKEFGHYPGASTRTSLFHPGQTNSHSEDIPRVPGSSNFQSVDSIQSVSTQNPQKSGANVHSKGFAITGRRPKSSNDSLRQPKKERTIAAPPLKPVSSNPPRSQSVEAMTRHDHAVLEVLFNFVFEGRFINTSPTAILPSLLNIYFKTLIASPQVDMPTPPASKGRVKDTFGTGDVNMVPLKPVLKGPVQPVASPTNRYPVPLRSRTLSRSASIPLRPTEQCPRPRKDLSASSESEESDFTYWSVQSLATPTTPPEQPKGITFVKEEERPGETKKEFPSLSLLTMFDEEDDAREAIISPSSKRARFSPETAIVQADEAPITLDAALAAIERHDHFYKEPPSAFRRRSVDVGSLMNIYQRIPARNAEKRVRQSHTRVKARDSTASALCLVLPRALFKLDERDMALHLRKTYIGKLR
jgi:hypothetical protein